MCYLLWVCIRACLPRHCRMCVQHVWVVCTCTSYLIEYDMNILNIMYCTWNNNEWMYIHAFTMIHVDVCTCRCPSGCLTWYVHVQRSLQDIGWSHSMNVVKPSRCVRNKCMYVHIHVHVCIHVCTCMCLLLYCISYDYVIFKATSWVHTMYMSDVRLHVILEMKYNFNLYMSY